MVAAMNALRMSPTSRKPVGIPGGYQAERVSKEKREEGRRHESGAADETEGVGATASAFAAANEHAALDKVADAEGGGNDEGVPTP